MSSIFRDTIRENERETGDIITGEIFSISELFSEDATQEGGNNHGKYPLFAYKENSDIYTLYHQQAMKSDDRKDLLLTMVKEVTDQINNGNFSLIIREEIPEGSTLLPGVCKMKRNRYIKAHQNKKWKAILNVDCSRMNKGYTTKKCSHRW